MTNATIINLHHSVARCRPISLYLFQSLHSCLFFVSSSRLRYFIAASCHWSYPFPSRVSFSPIYLFSLSLCRPVFYVTCLLQLLPFNTAKCIIFFGLVLNPRSWFIPIHIHLYLSIIPISPYYSFPLFLFSWYIPIYTPFPLHIPMPLHSFLSTL